MQESKHKFTKVVSLVLKGGKSIECVQSRLFIIIIIFIFIIIIIFIITIIILYIIIIVLLLFLL